MGAAGGIIGLALQGAGMFGGGGGGGRTVYQPDERAKFEADQLAFDAALDSHRIGENILRDQNRTQQGFDKYAYDLQTMQIERELESQRERVHTQYNMSLFNNSMQRVNNELTNYMTNAQLNQAFLNSGYENEATRRALDLERMGSQLEFKMSDADREFRKAQLGVAGDAAATERVLRDRGFGISEAELMDAETGIGYQQQDIDLGRRGLAQRVAEGHQQLDTQLATGDIAANLARGGAEQQRGDTLRALLRGMTDSEREFARFDALLGATGRKSGTQTGQAKLDQINDQLRHERSSMMSRYGLQIGQAGIEQDMNRAQVELGRRNLEQNRRIEEQGFKNREGQLDLARSDVSRQRGRLSLDRRMSDLQFERDETQREIETLRLSAAQEYDLFSKSLLPEMRIKGQGLAAEWNMANTRYGIDLQRHGQAQQYSITDSILEEQALLDRDMAQQAYDTMIADYELQSHSNIARYLAAQGNTSLKHASGLNQLGARTYGILSKLGGYRSPPPG